LAVSDWLLAFSCWLLAFSCWLLAVSFLPARDYQLDKKIGLMYRFVDREPEGYPAGSRFNNRPYRKKVIQPSSLSSL
jgi:hypothetical protein